MERSLTHTQAAAGPGSHVRASLQPRPSLRPQVARPRGQVQLPRARGCAAPAVLAQAATDGGLAERSMSMPDLGAAEAQPRITLVHSPTEFKDLCTASGHKLVVLMCKAASCRPCKAFARRYARASEKYTDTTFVEIYGDETKDTRAMMVGMKIRVTPTFLLFRDGERVYSWGGVSESNFHKALTEHLQEGEVGFGTFDPAAYPEKSSELGH